jgi:hypothetical protein
MAKAREAAAAQLERDRAAADARAKADADAKRIEDLDNRERVHAKIAEGIFAHGRYTTTEDAQNIVDAIAAGRIRHLTINY